MMLFDIVTFYGSGAAPAPCSCTLFLPGKPCHEQHEHDGRDYAARTYKQNRIH